jgi:hypothetical protein
MTEKDEGLGTSEYKFKITRTVGTFKMRRKFTVYEVVARATPEQTDVREGRPDDILNFMRCVKKVTRGTRAQKAEWKRTRGDSKKGCKDCYFYRLLPNKTLACGIIEPPIPDDKVLFDLEDLSRSGHPHYFKEILKGFTKPRSKY